MLRRILRLPAKLPGTMNELRDERVEPSTVLMAVAVSMVGGAGPGPEDAVAIADPAHVTASRTG